MKDKFNKEMRISIPVLLYSFFLLSSLQAQTIGRLWGMTAQGGDSGGGVIFNYDKLIFHDSVIYNMPFTPQNPEYTNLIQASDGNFYGMTEGGGDFGAGTIFKLNSATGKLITLVSFSGAANGSIPYGSLIQGSDGNLYGMTYGGGSTFFGTIFKCTTTGVLTTLVTFTGAANGSNPYGSLIQASDGNLYGMTSGGGSSGDGTIFKCTTAGALTTLVNFAGTANGSSPYGSLIQASDGNLYGMTETGGTFGDGTIFKCSTSGTLTTLVNFNGTNGANPYGSIVQVTNGNFYGMTEAGGTYNYGTIFKCTTSGTLTTLVNFNDTNGVNPFGNLIQASDGNLYGMANAGGVFSNGIIFRCDTSGVFDTLISFNGAGNGSNPEGGFIQTSDGNLYGMTNQGGASGLGTIFKCTTAGALSDVIIFGVTAIGSNPGGSLIQAKNGNLYGMTYGGGSSGYDGTVFMVNNNTGVVSTLLNFNDTNGANPYGSLIQATDSNFYGVTEAGGSTSLSNTDGGSAGDGVIFKINSVTGTISNLVSFTGAANGASPLGTLIQGIDGNLYGVTEYGGSSHDGIIFKCSTTGTFTTLVTFNGTNGKFPFNSLVQGTDSNLYGMTQNGGSSNDGTIFKCTTSGTLTTLVNFAGANGRNPMGNLVQASDGNFYGCTEAGGSSDVGTVFKCAPSGALSTLVNFNTANGANPSGSLIQASDGNLYGMTLEGGSSGKGTLFECTTSGALTTLVNFNGIDNGSNPQYGNLLEAMSTSINVSTDCKGVSTLADSVRGARYPCTYLWSTGATTVSINGITTSGSYSVAVTDSRGIRVTANILVPVYSPLSVIPDSSIYTCNGKSIDLYASSSGGTGALTYTWMPGNLNGMSPSVSPSATTTYTVIVTDASGCKDSATQIIKVNALPAITINGSGNITTGSSDVLTASGGVSYKWSNGSTSDTAVVKPLVNTTYTVTGTGTDGCEDTASFTVIVNPSGINTLGIIGSIVFYPDPVINALNIKFDSLQKGRSVLVKISDASGRQVMSRMMIVDNVMTMDVSSLVQGLYFVSILTDKNSAIGKFVKN